LSRKIPCRNCEKRNSICHGSCDIYKAWRKEKDELNRIIAQEKRSVVADYVRERRFVLGR
jgi:hypothetical protein